MECEISIIIKVFDSPTNGTTFWDAAAVLCEDHDATLPIVRSSAENAWLTGTLPILQLRSLLVRYSSLHNELSKQRRVLLSINAHRILRCFKPVVIRDKCVAMGRWRTEHLRELASRPSG